MLLTLVGGERYTLRGGKTKHLWKKDHGGRLLARARLYVHDFLLFPGVCVNYLLLQQASAARVNCMGMNF